MYFYVGENALNELNIYGCTDILNEDGEGFGASLIAHGGSDLYIYNLFDCEEVIYLDEIKLEDDHFNCTVTTNDIPTCFALYILKPTNYGLKTKWKRE